MKRRLVQSASVIVGIVVVLVASGCQSSPPIASTVTSTDPAVLNGAGVLAVDLAPEARKGARAHVKIVAVDGEAVPASSREVIVEPGVRLVTVQPTWSNYSKQRQTLRVVVRPGRRYVVRCEEQLNPSTAESLGTAATVATGLFVVTEPLKAIAGADAPPTSSTCYVWVADAYSDYTVAGVNPNLR